MSRCLWSPGLTGQRSGRSASWRRPQNRCPCPGPLHLLARSLPARDQRPRSMTRRDVVSGATSVASRQDTDPVDVLAEAASEVLEIACDQVGGFSGDCPTEDRPVLLGKVYLPHRARSSCSATPWWAGLRADGRMPARCQSGGARVVPRLRITEGRCSHRSAGNGRRYRTIRQTSARG
jgi:hypothetical protein